MTLLQGIGPVGRETVPSLVARLAASKGVTLQQLVFDLGGSMKRLVSQDRVLLENLAAWTGLEDAQLKDLLSWTGEPIGGVRMRFRNETFVTRALRNPIVQGCPRCLRDDALSAPEAPLVASYAGALADARGGDLRQTRRAAGASLEGAASNCTK